LDFIESCRRFISLDSTPSQGNLAAARFAVELCKAKGLEVETMEEIWADQTQMNVIARPPLGKDGEEELLLQNHLDTVDPGPFGLWTRTGNNPFDAHIIDKKIYGLGAADVKLDFICKIEALASFAGQKNWKMKPVLVGTFAEEQGMVGALKLIRKNKIKARKALIGEPSNLQLISAGKGTATVEIRIPFSDDEYRYRQEHNLRESTSTQSRIFNGKAAHSSTPHLGESAIKKMLEYLLQMPEDLTIMEIDGGVNFNTVPSNAFLEIEPVSGHREPMAAKIAKIYRTICDLEGEFLQFQDPLFNPPYPTLVIGIIRTLQNHVFISGNCRVVPLVSQEIYDKWMRELKEVCQSVGADFRITDYKIPFQTSPDSPFVKGCLEDVRGLVPSGGLATQSSTNEASLFSRVGIECICFGPGQREGNIHTPNEHVAIDDLHTAGEVYKRIIKRFCL